MQPVISKESPVAKALGRVASGLFVVTSVHEGKRAAYLASFVQQVSFDPLVFAIACHPERYPYQLIKASGKFGLSILPDNDKVLLKTFAKGYGPTEDPLSSISTHVILDVPLLKDALAGAVFEVTSETKPGDHVVFFGKALDGVVFDEALKPWVHVRANALNY